MQHHKCELQVSNIEEIRQQVVGLRQIINTTFESGELVEVGKQITIR